MTGLSPLKRSQFWEAESKCWHIGQLVTRDHHSLTLRLQSSPIQYEGPGPVFATRTQGTNPVLGSSDGDQSQEDEEMEG